MQITLQVDPKNASEVAHGILILHALTTDEVMVGGVATVERSVTARLATWATHTGASSDDISQPPSPASVFSEEDVANATRELAATSGIPAATSLLAAFQIERARDLPAEAREQYITEAKRLVTAHKATA